LQCLTNTMLKVMHKSNLVKML